MTKKITIYIVLIGLMLSLSNCDDWLTINPKSEIAGDVLFESQDGFKIALNGIYSNISSTALYGKELKFGFVDVLAQCYAIGTSTYEGYEGIANYQYFNEGAKNIIENIWAKAYNTIANCNSILQQLENKDDAFFESQHVKNMIEGETLSLRAMLYFDLLRLFAPATIIEEEEEAIPYYSQLTNTPMPYIKTSEILDSLIADLQRSKDLQKEFDTSVEAKEHYIASARFKDSYGFFSNGRRGFRMGYYATTALLAKVAQYAGEKEIALNNAKELVENDNLIDFTQASKIEADKYDRLLSEDIIFALYNKNFEQGFYKNAFLIDNVEAMFGNDGDDFRKKCFLLNYGDKFQLTKYILAKDLYSVSQTILDREGNGSIVNIIPMFRLSEMYYILIESLFDTEPGKAIDLFTQFRTKRGCKMPLPSITSKNELLNYLVNDARREFMGEGQLFYIYKRLNKPVINENRGNKILTEEFIIPIPERETSFML
jgi:hypothetical protein